MKKIVASNLGTDTFPLNQSRLVTKTDETFEKEADTILIHSVQEQPKDIFLSLKNVKSNKAKNLWLPGFTFNK